MQRGVEHTLSAFEPQPSDPVGNHQQRFVVISEMLLAALTRTLTYPKLRKRILPETATAFAGWVRAHGSLAEDPASPPPVGSRDPDNDYLLALAIDRRAYLVTGDHDRLVLGGDLPILTPAEFLDKLRESR